METASIAENIEQQLCEVEMLEAMFPGQDELQMDDENILEEVRKWMLASANHTDLEFRPPRISFTLCLTFNDSEKDDMKKRIDVNVLYPFKYPQTEAPELYIKSKNDSLNRVRQLELNEALSTYLTENVILGESCLISVISWLQENCPKYINLSKEDESLKHASSATSVKPAKLKNTCFARFWIYSHHIYSKIKRRDILDLSDEFELSGFCMPGKPGIICMEGCETNCNEAWSVIKSWNWKKINIKHQETQKVDVDINEHIDKCRRFKGFEEIGFIKNSDTRDYHMDMGEFSKYLDQNNSLYMFKEIFGFDKKAA